MSENISLFPHTYSNKNNKSTKRAFTLPGFTLVELLIAVSIFSVVSIAIYSTFFSGASILRRIRNVDLRQQKILLRVEMLGRELRQQPSYKKQLFSGAKARISFAGSLDYFPCRLTYYFDSSSLCMMRVADRLDEITTPEGTIEAGFKDKPSVFLSKVKDVKFSYFYFDLKQNTYKWTDQWQEDYLPTAVKFTITDENQEYDSTVFLPTA